MGGAGPPVLICHATGFCGRAYGPLAQALGDRFHVWALDMPGHGDSDDPPGGDFSWRAMVGRRRRRDPGDRDEPLACVVGHSMGGAVALQAAAEDPALFAAAYLFEPIISEPAGGHRAAPAAIRWPMAPAGGRARSPRNPRRSGATRAARP